jgi:hypothetical protein
MAYADCAMSLASYNQPNGVEFLAVRGMSSIHFLLGIEATLPQILVFDDLISESLSESDVI